MRVEGRARALQEAEDHLAMRELMAELELLPGGSLEWLARLMALEDVVVAHVQGVEVHVFPRLGRRAG